MFASYVKTSAIHSYILTGCVIDNRQRLLDAMQICQYLSIFKKNIPLRWYNDAGEWNGIPRHPHKVEIAGSTPAPREGQNSINGSPRYGG